MKLMIRMFLVVLLLLVLAACGGGEEAVETPELPVDSGDAGAAAVAAAAEAPVVAEEAAAVVEDVPAAADDALADAVGQAEALVGGAAVDAAVGAIQGLAAEVVPEAEADGEPAANPAPSGRGWGESGSGPQSACDHPYLPLREGATWTYDTGEGPYSWEVTSVEGNMDSATAVVLVTIEDIALEYKWDCAAGQGITSSDFASQSLGASFPEMTMEVTASEGVFLPPAEQLVPGHTWDAHYEQTIEFNMAEAVEGVDGEAMLVKADVTTEQTNTVLSADPITAAGISVDGVQFEQVSDMLMAMDMLGTAVNQTVTLSGTFELGWGVGIMRQTLDAELGPSGVELLSFYIP